MINKILGVLKVAATIKNLKSKSSQAAAVAASTAVAAPMVLPEQLPPDSLEKAIVQTVLGLIALYGFFKDCKQ